MGTIAALLFIESRAGYRDASFEYKKGETWDRVLHQGIQLLERFAQSNRVHISRPKENIQIKVVQELPNANQFVSYIDAVGELDGLRCLIDWKTTTSRYTEEPEGLLSLDPQLVCYSWATGISEVALVVRAKASSRDPVSEGFHFGSTTPGIWSPSGDHDRPNRGCPIPAAQRHSISAERLRELPPSWSMPRQSKPN